MVERMCFIPDTYTLRVIDSEKIPDRSMGKSLLEQRLREEYFPFGKKDLYHQRRHGFNPYPEIYREPWMDAWRKFANLFRRKKITPTHTLAKGF